MKQRRRIWVEDESSMIGSLHLPEVIVGRLASSPFVYLKTHSERRIHELVHEYGQQARAELEGAFRKIARKIGGQYLNLALEALNAGRLDEAAAIALRYYDKAYAQSLSIRHPDGGMPLSWGANEEVDQVVNRLLGIIKSKQIIPINK